MFCCDWLGHFTTGLSSSSLRRLWTCGATHFSFMDCKTQTYLCCFHKSPTLCLQPKSISSIRLCLVWELFHWVDLPSVLYFVPFFWCLYKHIRILEVLWKLPYQSIETGSALQLLNFLSDLCAIIYLAEQFHAALLLTCSQNKLDLKSWRTIMRGLEEATSLTSLNGFEGFDKLLAGNCCELELSGSELALAVAPLLPRNASELTKLDLRYS